MELHISDLRCFEFVSFIPGCSIFKVVSFTFLMNDAHGKHVKRENSWLHSFTVRFKCRFLANTQ
jgi:hypothetical protein